MVLLSSRKVVLNALAKLSPRSWLVPACTQQVTINLYGEAKKPAMALEIVSIGGLPGGQAFQHNCQDSRKMQSSVEDIATPLQSNLPNSAPNP
jgi:hypothetical protein